MIEVTNVNIGNTQDLVPTTSLGPKLRKNGKSVKEMRAVLKLPVLLLSNIQRFGKSESKDKTLEIEEILVLNNVGIAVFCETWLTDETIDRLPFKPYQKFHHIRKNVARSSGGVSILVENSLPASRLNIQIPDNLECIWVTVRPGWLPRSVSNIVICGVYYPGSNSVYSPKQEALIFHITTSVQYLKRKYVNPLFFIMGDFNDLPIDSISAVCEFKQVVKVITRGEATLDLILTNKSNSLFEEPVSLPKIGDGDHFPILYLPKNYIPPKSIKKIVNMRKFPKSTKNQFGAWISCFDWGQLYNISDANDKIRVACPFLCKK